MRWAGLICGIVVFAHTAAPSAAQPSAWDTFSDSYGTSIPYPSRLFPVASGPGEPPGKVLQTEDGTGRLHIFTVPNERAERPAQFLKRLFPPQSVGKLSYVRVTRDFFVVSEPNDGQALYRRCNFVGRMIHCFDIRYPLSQKRAYDDIVTRMSRSLRPR